MIRLALVTAAVDIVLATFNAGYAHCALGLRYLQAQLGALARHARICEFTLEQKPIDAAETILALEPRLVGLGVYIWNVEATFALASLLRRLRPQLTIVLGGPEVSFPPDDPPGVELADYVIAGEADGAFARLCAAVLEGRPPREQRLTAEAPVLDELILPYDLYSDEDIAQRTIYVETTRGCPFACDYCLSARGGPPRRFDLERVFPALDRLLERGAAQLRFVDRTFNAAGQHSLAIMRFLLERAGPDRFFHFEVRPELLDADMLELAARFPAGTLQFEVGVQTLNPEVAQLIGRPLDLAGVERSLAWLRARTHVHIHADLIAGLPGESLASFADGFDRLLALRPHEIQVGILKRLRGAPVARHDEAWRMIYNHLPPYEILENRLVSFGEMQRLRRFARLWDSVANSGNFRESHVHLWQARGTPFASFLRFSDWLFARAGRVHAIGLPRLAEYIFHYLADELELGAEEMALLVWRDYHRGGRRGIPPFLEGLVPTELLRQPPPPASAARAARRQARHVDVPTEK